MLKVPIGGDLALKSVVDLFSYGLNQSPIVATITVISRWPRFNVGKHNMVKLLARALLRFVNNIERVGAGGRL